jgi:ABC-2 type transport system ATP-binding protein
MVSADTSLAVRTADLSKQFGDVTAVAGLTLSVQRGEVFGMVGPDGAGKTTTMRILCAVMLPTSGTAEVAGVNVVESPAEAKCRTGYLSQQFSQYGDLTVWENIGFAADLYGVPRRQWHERAEELLRASRLTEFKTRLARNLSGGMKQKLALTCALIHSPEVLFLDEPTTGVDPVSRREFWTILHRLPSEGVTVVVSTPYMDEAERCMRLAFIRDGRVLDCATPQELKRRVRGEVIAFSVSPVRPARDLLRQQQCVRQATIFGDQLHVVVADADRDLPTLTDALKSAGIEVRGTERIAATLEDVFIELTQSDPVS